MLTMGNIKKWITDILINDTDFADKVNATIGKSLNYYRSSPVDIAYEQLPYLTVFSGNISNHKFSQRIYNPTYEIAIAIAISGNVDSVDDNNVEVWESTDKVEILATSMYETLNNKIKCGIIGFDVEILSFDLIVTEIGEAYDVQANVIIQFGQTTSI